MRIYFPVRFLLASLPAVGMARSAHAQFSQRGSINPGGTYSVGAMFASGGVQITAGGVSGGSHDNWTYVNGVNVNDN